MAGNCGGSLLRAAQQRDDTADPCLKEFIVVVSYDFLFAYATSEIRPNSRKALSPGYYQWIAMVVRTESERNKMFVHTAVRRDLDPVGDQGCGGWWVQVGVSGGLEHDLPLTTTCTQRLRAGHTG
jgi:hypothetical protein